MARRISSNVGAVASGTEITGVNDPYEEPLNPEEICYSDGRETPDQSAARVIAKLKELGYSSRPKT